MLRQAPTGRSNPRRSRVAAACLALALAVGVTISIGLAGGAAGPESAGAQGAKGGKGAFTPAGRPNIIVLLTDDQEKASMRVMKTVNKDLKREGVTLKRFYDNFPLCCPARSTLLTGQYAHNHGVLSNVPPDGGYGVFNEKHGDNYLPIWLQNAGYTTSYIGKYENGYAEPDEYGTTPREIPRGWDDWRVLAPSRAQYFKYQLNQNGRLTQATRKPRDYSTDVFTTKAKRFIRKTADSPFYLELGYAAPHGGGGGSPGRSCNRAAEPAPRDLGTLKGKFKGTLSPSFNEADVSDKPSPIANLAPLTEGQVRDTLRKRRCAWESLLAVDRSVGEIVDELARDGLLHNTYIFYVSDNGYLRGEHRIRNNKRFLYEESARVPIVVRGPGVAHGAQSNDVLVNADLTATFLEISGAAPGLVQDGQSLLPSLAQPELEHGRAILLEAYAGQPILGVRTARYLYAEWDTGEGPPEKELYDTYVDPYQLDNQASNPAYAQVVADLGRELDEMIDCAGADCRGQPTGQVAFTSTGTGKRGCAFPPVYARFDGALEGIASVDFFVDKKFLGADPEPPFEVALPDDLLRSARPGRAEVLLRANFADGRRLAVVGKIRACR
ncbi:MAG: sulfatase-like hydrolase/transferase [Solirubrobacterales bacterium]|nr:sulfatase-like hydrolase/transferase [Solirubrobacterales bacterium]